MRVKNSEQKTIFYLDKIVCDFCKKEYFTSSLALRDVIEVQEFVSIHTTGGYGSIFGDGDPIDVDMCQSCFKKIVIDQKVIT